VCLIVCVLCAIVNLTYKTEVALVMNRFIIPASELCDKHAVKMPLEEAQMLCTAHHELGSAVEGMYKPAHRNHPCSIWVRKTRGNYMWAFKYFRDMLIEKQYRFGKPHASGRLFNILVNPPKNIDQSEEITEFPQCMPDEFKCDDALLAYKSYLNSKFSEWSSREKPIIAKWTRRKIPDWVIIS
jgi:hypothetical protein